MIIVLIKKRLEHLSANVTVGLMGLEGRSQIVNNMLIIEHGLFIIKMLNFGDLKAVSKS